MDSQNLLEKNRMMHHLLHKAANDVANFDHTAAQLHQIVKAAVYIVDQKGNIVAAKDEGLKCVFSLQELQEGRLNAEDQQFVYRYMQTGCNLYYHDMCILVVPITNMGERIGAVLYSRDHHEFSTEDVLLGEYGAAISAVQLLREANRKAETEARKKNVVQLAFEVLSYSELEAVKYIFDEIEGNEGFLVASKLAEEYKLTRSVIVNALRKLESAGVIDARSLGMKGTYIKVLNDYLYEELEKA